MDTPGSLERILTGCGLYGYPAQVGEGFNAGLAAKAANTAVLDTTERHLGFVVDSRAVDVADASLDTLGHLYGSASVFAKYC